MRTGTVFAPPTPGARRILEDILHPEPDRNAAHGRADWSRVDWERLFSLARMNKVDGLLAGRLEDLGLSGALPEEAERALAGIRAAGMGAAARYERTLTGVRSLFEGERIPNLVVKGAVLGARLYGDPARRPSYDVDFVVPRRFVEKADRLLLGAGYEMLKPRGRHLLFAPLGVRRSLRHGGKLSPDRAREVYLDYHYHFPFVLPPGDDRLPVDLHWQLTHERVWDASEEGLWAETVTEDGAPRTLNREATLVYSAVHALEQGADGVKLRDFVDVAWTMSDYRKSGDPRAVIDLAERWGVTAHLFAAAEAVECLFPGAATGYRGDGMPPGWPARCFRRAGFPDLLWESAEPETKVGRLSRRLSRQTCWDIALKRPPRSASRTLLAYLLRATPPPRGKGA